MAHPLAQIIPQKKNHFLRTSKWGGLAQMSVGTDQDSLEGNHRGWLITVIPSFPAENQQLSNLIRDGNLAAGSSEK